MPALGERYEPDGAIELRPYPAERGGAEFEVAIVVHLGIDGIPVSVEEAIDQLQALTEAGETFQFEQRFGHPSGDLQIFAALSKCVFAELQDERIIGGFDIVLPDALADIGLFAASFLDLVGDGVVAEIGAGG